MTVAPKRKMRGESTSRTVRYWLARLTRRPFCRVVSSSKMLKPSRLSSTLELPWKVNVLAILMSKTVRSS